MWHQGNGLLSPSAFVDGTSVLQNNVTSIFRVQGELISRGRVVTPTFMRGRSV